AIRCLYLLGQRQTGYVEEFCQHQRDLSIVPIGRLSTTENQIKGPYLADSSAQHLGSHKAVGQLRKERILAQNEIIGPHAQRFLHNIQGKLSPYRHHSNRCALTVLQRSEERRV